MSINPFLRTISTLLGAALVMMTCSARVVAQAPVPSDDDPAFRTFFDSKQLGDALADANAARITDSALLLRRGEDILLRERTGISSNKLFALAMTVAVENGDDATLARLDKALRGKASKELIAELDAALLLGKKKRKADPFASESPSPEAQVLYKSVAEEIRMAKTLNDRTSLEGMLKNIDKLTELTAQQRKHLRSQAAAALTEAPRTPASEDDFLAQLVRASRSTRKTILKK